MPLHPSPRIAHRASIGACSACRARPHAAERTTRVAALRPRAEEHGALRPRAEGHGAGTSMGMAGGAASSVPTRSAVAKSHMPMVSSSLAVAIISCQCAARSVCRMHCPLSHGIHPLQVLLPAPIARRSAPRTVHARTRHRYGGCTYAGRSPARCTSAVCSEPFGAVQCSAHKRHRIG